MDEETHLYLITAYSEWEVLDVEAQCHDDEQAVAKARRYGSLQHIKVNFPKVIFSHVVRIGNEGREEVGTWEYRLGGEKTRQGLFWHAGEWATRPDPDDRIAIRHWVASS